MDDAMSWIEAHPWLAAALGLGGVLILLWLLGFFGSSSTSSSNTSSNNLASAYYAAEAAQTTAGTQLNIATVEANSQDALATTQANAATAIAATQAGMYTTLGQQNASTTTALGNDQLLASNNSNDDALAAANTAAAYGYQTAVAANNASVLSSYLNNVVPTAMTYGGGFNQAYLGTGIGDVSFAPTSTYASPTQLYAQGYTQAGVAAIEGQPIGNIA